MNTEDILNGFNKPKVQSNDGTVKIHIEVKTTDLYYDDFVKAVTAVKKQYNLTCEKYAGVVAFILAAEYLPVKIAKQAEQAKQTAQVKK